MENNNLKENIRKKVKEKIAVSNIREEFDMKSKRNNKVIYGILSACAILVLCLVVSKNIKYPLNITNNVEVAKNDNVNQEKNNIELAQNNNITQEENNITEDRIIFNNGSLASNADMDIDGKWQEADLKEEFEFINEIYIPNGLYLSDQGKIFLNNDLNTVDYSKVRQYNLIFSTKSMEDPPNIGITFTKEQTILGCMMPKEEETPSSTINGKEVKLFKSKYIRDESKIDGYAFFEKDGYKFYINAHRIDEEDFIKVVKSIL